MSVFVDGHCHLDTPQKMIAAFGELCGENAKPFRGAVSCWPVGDGTSPAQWGLEVNDWDGGSVAATLGDHLILTYGRLLKLTDTEYQEQATVGPTVLKGIG